MTNGTVDQLELYKPIWRPWREIALLMLMLMEVSWVVPWFRSLTPATHSANTLTAFIIFIGMMVAAHLIIRGLNYLNLKIIIRQVVMILFLVISILIGLKLLLYSGESTSLLGLINRPLQNFADWTNLIPDEFIVSIAIIIGWWRGITLAQEHVGPHLVMNHFIIGILMFFLFGILNTMVTGETPGILLYVFIFTSLLAMGSARMSVLHTLRGGGKPIFDRKWFLGMSLSAFVIVLITIISVSFFAGGTGILEYIISGLFYLFTLLTYLLFSPIILLLIWAFGNIPFDLEFFETIIASLRNLQSMMQQAINHFADLMNQSGISQMISDWGPSVKAILLWGSLILAVFVVAMWVAIRLWKERARNIPGDDQESLLTPGELWKLFRITLQNRVKELWGNLSDLKLFYSNRRLRAAERIRQIYIEMMDLCSRLNIPRPEAYTPIEYMLRVNDLFPNHTDDIELITIAYTRVRYGELPEQQREVAVVEEAWKRLSEEGEMLLENRKKQKIS